MTQMPVNDPQPGEVWCRRHMGPAPARVTVLGRVGAGSPFVRFCWLGTDWHIPLLAGVVGRARVRMVDSRHVMDFVCNWRLLFAPEAVRVYRLGELLQGAAAGGEQ